MITKPADEMQEGLLKGDGLEAVELGEVTTTTETKDVSNPEPPKSDLYLLLNFLFEQNARVTAIPRAIASAMYIASGIQYQTWFRMIGSGITCLYSIYAIWQNQKPRDIPSQESGYKYFLEMLQRSFQAKDHVRQFAGPMLILSSTCLGIGGVMSGRYEELLFTATGCFLGVLAMFVPKDVDANIYSARFRIWVMPIIFAINGYEAFKDGGDGVAISSMVLNQISTYFSGSINSWGKMNDDSFKGEKTWVNFIKICCWTRATDIDPADRDSLSAER